MCYFVYLYFDFVKKYIVFYLVVKSKNNARLIKIKVSIVFIRFKYETYLSFQPIQYLYQDRDERIYPKWF